jgi:hypothetical protein
MPLFLLTVITGLLPLGGTKGNQELAENRRKNRNYYNVANKSENWTDYKRTLTNYIKSLKQAKGESRSRHCEEIEKAPESASLSAPFNLKIKTTPQQRKGPWKNYCGSTSLVQKYFPKLLKAGTVLNCSF